MTILPDLCGVLGCRRVRGHAGEHQKYAREAWNFFENIDKNKIDKAGYATPRGGDKGAYQNHVYRNNKIIVPYERFSEVNLSQYVDGYVIRLYPEQYFQAPGVPKVEFSQPSNPVQVGINAFVLYGSLSSFDTYPPLPGWEVRYLTRNGNRVNDRSRDAEDHGHYVLRIPKQGARVAQKAGPPQGIFAPEYAGEEVNFLCQCVLAWLTVQTRGSPYTLTQALHLRSILENEGLSNIAEYEYRGVLRHGLTCCPLCMRSIHYSELHQMVSFDNETGLGNAAMQVTGATRSTIVNLFHIEPLTYSELTHLPRNVAWGHAVCNTRLGQRQCFSLAELQALDLKVGVIREDGIETFGWISGNNEMIRSPNGAVWIMINGDIQESTAPADNM